jgi:hypothetical protein
VNPERKKLSYRILNNFVAPCAAAVAIVVVWPVAIYMKGKELLSKKGASALQEEREFAVERTHLHEPLTVLQIEAREVVEDPLGCRTEFAVWPPGCSLEGLHRRCRS